MLLQFPIYHLTVFARSLCCFSILYCIILFCIIYLCRCRYLSIKLATKSFYFSYMYTRYRYLYTIYHTKSYILYIIIHIVLVANNTYFINICCCYRFLFLLLFISIVIILYFFFCEIIIKHIVKVMSYRKLFYKVIL